MRTLRYTAVIAAFTLLATVPISARAQSNAKEIMARKPAELVEILKNPQASTFEKAKACQRLAVVGTKDAVPALAALLSDEKLNCYARSALEGIADPAADEALRRAATKLQGRQLVGVLDSIGQRRDSRATKLLASLLADKDLAVASAAAGALGRIGTPEAGGFLFYYALPANSPVQLAAADGGLACAERLVAAGKTDAATHLYSNILARHDGNLPAHLRAAALEGLIRILGPLAKKPVLKGLHSTGKAYFEVCLAAARELPGAEMTAALANELKTLPSGRQALLLRALADRKEPVEISLLVAESKNESPVVQEAAIHALAKRGDTEAAKVLLDTALGDTKAARIANEGLKALPGRALDAAVSSRLDGANAKQKVALFELIGARQIVSAQAAVIRAMADADQSVRLAAIAAMGQLVDLDNLELLIDKALSKEGKPAETAAARAALKTAAQRMGDRDRCAAKLAERLKGAKDANQPYLLELLGKVSGPTALATVVASAKSSDPAIKDAATRVLGEWTNTEAAPALLDIVKNDPETKYQIRALRGYIRIARQLDVPWWTKSNAADTKLAMFHEAMKVAKRDEEKRLALDILTRIPSAATLDLAASHLTEPALKDAAAKAAVRIAAKIVADDPKAVAKTMRKVVEARVAGNTATRAKQLLDQAEATAK
jgi:HEAT repeat protein